MLGNLYNVHPAVAWAYKQWPDFMPDSGTADQIAVLPAASFRSWNPDWPLDLCESVGMALLRKACEEFDPQGEILRILPSWRFSIEAHREDSFFALDPDAGLKALAEIMNGVKLAGFRKVILFAMSPDLSSWLDVAGRELRISHHLQPFLIHLADLGYDPREPDSLMATLADGISKNKNMEEDTLSQVAANLLQAFHEIKNRPFLKEGGSILAPIKQ